MLTVFGDINYTGKEFAHLQMFAAGRFVKRNTV